MRIGAGDVDEARDVGVDGPCTCEEFRETAIKRSADDVPLCEAQVSRGAGYFRCRRPTTMALDLYTSRIRRVLCDAHRKQFFDHGSCAHCRGFFQIGLRLFCPVNRSHFTHISCAKRFSPPNSLICSHCNSALESESAWIDSERSVTGAVQKSSISKAEREKVENQETHERDLVEIKRVLDCSTDLPAGWLDGSFLSTLISNGSCEEIGAARYFGATVTADHLCQLADSESTETSRAPLPQLFSRLQLLPQFDSLLSTTSKAFDGNTVLSTAARRQNWDFFLRLLKFFEYRSVDVDMPTGSDSKSLRQICAQSPKNVQAAVDHAGMIHKYSVILKKVLHEDLSRGTERFPIRVVNDVDEEKPARFVYSTRVVDRCGVLKHRKTNEMLICNCRDGCEGDCECNSGVYDEHGRAKISMLETPFLECSSDCMCNMACKNRVAQKGATHPIEIFRTNDNRGWGVRAMCRIPKGTFIGEYTGELLTDADANRRIDSYLFETAVGDANFTIDARVVGNFTRFINHSCGPNAKVCMVVWDWQVEQLSHICVFAVRDIFKGEEITITYGDHWWRTKIVEFPCRCGSPLCQFNEKKREAVLLKLQQEQETVSTSASSASNYDSESSL